MASSVGARSPGAGSGQTVAMRVVDVSPESVSVVLTIDELALVNNALNEICHGVHELGDDGEFSIRVGQPRAAGKALLREVGSLLREVPRGSL